MTPKQAGPQRFNIMIVGQQGRLQYEAVLFAASLRAMSPEFAGQLIVAEPQPGPLWSGDPRMDGHVTGLLHNLGAQVRPFTSDHFGTAYPYGNKIEGLKTLPAGEPFVFFDTDTLITGELSDIPFDFNRPAASMKREGTWPVEELYWPGYTAIWKSLYDKFGLDFESSWTCRSLTNSGNATFISMQAGSLGPTLRPSEPALPNMPPLSWPTRQRNWPFSPLIHGWIRLCCRWLFIALGADVQGRT